MRSLCAVHAPCMMLSRATDVQKILFGQTINIYVRHKSENRCCEGEKVKRPGRIEPVSLCASRLLPGAGVRDRLRARATLHQRQGAEGGDLAGRQ